MKAYCCDHFKYLKENVLNDSALYIGTMDDGDFIYCHIRSFSTLAKLYNNTLIRYQKIQAWMGANRRYLVLSKIKLLNLNRSNHCKKLDFYNNLNNDARPLHLRSKKKRKLH